MQTDGQLADQRVQVLQFVLDRGEQDAALQVVDAALQAVDLRGELLRGVGGRRWTRSWQPSSGYWPTWERK